MLPCFQIPFNFIHLNDNSTLTGGVWIGEEFWVNGFWDIEDVEVGENSLLGDTGTLARGKTPNNSIIGCLAVVDQPLSEISQPYSVALGNRSTWTKYSYSNVKVQSVRESDFANSWIRPILDVLLLFLTTFLTEIRTLKDFFSSRSFFCLRCPFIHSFIHSFIHWCIHWFIHQEVC